jgi:hypothetical protein
MVTFPKGKLSERRKTTMQNEARDERVKAFETELKKLVRNLLESPYAGGVGDVLRDTLHKRQRLLHPRPPYPRGAGGGPQGSPRTGRRFPSQDPSLPKAGLLGAVGDHPCPLRCRS